jgi:hypothetical protein
MYNVLWIDDQYKDAEMIQFAIEADNNGLLLDGYPSFEEGFDALERKLEYYDVILLDGLFFEKKGQEVGTEDEAGIGMAIARINELKSRKFFPWFVLSGKDKFTKAENSLLKANKARCFDKTNPTDVVKLFEEMKVAASHQPDAQLKHKYADLLEMCSDQLLGPEHFSRLYPLIKHIEYNGKVNGGEDILTAVRKIVEGLFATLAQYQIIPNQLVGEKGWINGSSHFLSDRHNDYILQTEIVPPLVAFNIHRLLDIIQDGSHAYGELKYKVDKYMKDSQSDYFFRSTVFLLFDVLLWFKVFIANNIDKEVNKGRWGSKVSNDDWILGYVKEIKVNGWGVFQPNSTSNTIDIPDYMIKEHKLNQDDSMKVIPKQSPDGKRTFIKAISK